MTTLERELAALSAGVDWPGTPDVTSVVAARIESVTPRRTPHLRLAVALAVVVAAGLAVLAVPPARSAIFDWLGFGGARIVRVDELPAVAATPGLEILGDRVSLSEANARAGFPFVGPPGDERQPDEVRVAPGARVSYVWRDGRDVRLLVTQFPGTATEPELVKKLVSAATRVETLSIDGHPALWLEGGPHAVLFVDSAGMVRDDMGWLAGNTLLVTNDGVTVRIEAAVDRADAVDIARALLE